MGFHEVRFPLEISRGAQGGPERKTDIVVSGSGYEERNSRWANSRRIYNAGYGVKSLDDLYRVITFFEERRGRFHGFRWRDPMDWKSCTPSGIPAATDQVQEISEEEGVSFQLRKTYGMAHHPWVRHITKPEHGSVKVAVDGVRLSLGDHFIVDVTTGKVTFLPGHNPKKGARITAGFMFDVPVRFDADKLEVNVMGFRHGSIPNIPISEIRL